jgi:hypothetical protein
MILKRLRPARHVLFLPWLAVFIACGPFSVRADNPGAVTVPTFEFRGEVSHQALEGGFWAIVADDGRRFDPGKLPPEFQQAGLKVRVVAKLAKDRLSFRQWGQAIDIVSLSREDADRKYRK